MRFWFDTEFIDRGEGQRVTLLSVGIVAQDGREYYAETHRAHKKNGLTPWLIENVKPHLDRAFRKDRWTIAREIAEFVGRKPEFWAYCGAYDWVCLSQLYGPLIDRPKGWPWNHFDCYQLPDFRKYEVKVEPKHNALADARSLMLSWEAWRAANAADVQAEPKDGVR
jgi:hypothetical protein